MPNSYDLAAMQLLARSDGLAYTDHAIDPGRHENNTCAQMSAAIAYWQARLAEGGVAAPPVAPVPTNIATTGTVLAGIYGVIVSYVNSQGETIGSPAGTTTTSGSLSVITVPSPVAATNATGWYAYVTQANGATYTRQQAAGSPTAIGTPLTISAPPTSTGTAPVTYNQTGLFTGPFGPVIADAIAHLTARLAYFNNPSGTVPVADRT